MKEGGECLFSRWCFRLVCSCHLITFRRSWVLSGGLDRRGVECAAVPAASHRFHVPLQTSLSRSRTHNLLSLSRRPRSSSLCTSSDWSRSSAFTSVGHRRSKATTSNPQATSSLFEPSPASARIRESSHCKLEAGGDSPLVLDLVQRGVDLVLRLAAASRTVAKE